MTPNQIGFIVVGVGWTIGYLFLLNMMYRMYITNKYYNRGMIWR